MADLSKGMHAAVGAPGALDAHLTAIEAGKTLIQHILHSGPV